MWNSNGNAYYVWLSEIMLQQTQVATALPYFSQFIQQFPDIAALAQADLEKVLLYWQGLGYYARARNLHQAARIWFATGMPTGYAEWLALPGIGPSTAAACASSVQGEQTGIFDGNVRRVLARIFGVNQTRLLVSLPDTAQIEYTQQQVDANLYQLAQQLAKTVARQNMPMYTQSLMDFGATICKKKPLCVTQPKACIFEQHCYAHQQQQIAEFPSVAPKKAKAVVALFCLYIATSDAAEIAKTNDSNAGNAFFRLPMHVPILWQKLAAPISGMRIWQNLYVPMLFETEHALLCYVADLNLLVHSGSGAFRQISAKQLAAPIKHVLTHRILWLHHYGVVLHSEVLTQLLHDDVENLSAYQSYSALEMQQKPLAKPMQDALKLIYSSGVVVHE